MKIKINNKTIDLNPMLKKGIGIIEIDKCEKLIATHKGSVRNILIGIDDFDDLYVSHKIYLLKPINQIKKELKEN